MVVGDTVQTKGCAAVMDPEKDKTLVEFLLEFKDATDMLLRDAFQKNEAFVYSAKRAFEKVVNCKEGRPAELIGALVVPFPLLLCHMSHFVHVVFTLALCSKVCGFVPEGW